MFRALVVAHDWIFEKATSRAGALMTLLGLRPANDGVGNKRRKDEISGTSNNEFTTDVRLVSPRLLRLT